MSATTTQRLILATFIEEEDLVAAVHAIDGRGWDVVDVHAPYFVHGLEEALGWRRSRLPVACFLFGAAGVGLALWFQFWTTARDWPLNVGGRPWNSLPAFVPVAFESMVLLGGLGLVFAWLIRCRLYPGKTARLPLPGLTDDRFMLVLQQTAIAADAGETVRLLRECGATIEGQWGQEDQL